MFFILLFKIPGNSVNNNQVDNFEFVRIVGMRSRGNSHWQGHLFSRISQIVPQVHISAKCVLD